jgi:uncharacterized protein YecT (DUF1311 family)
MKYSFVLMIILYSLFSTLGVRAQDINCAEPQQTQMAMNICAAKSSSDSEVELQALLKQIQTAYADDPVFLQKLKEAQQAWQVSREADFLMKYPLVETPGAYGTVFGLCASGFKENQIRQRIEFLRSWAVGHGDGFICGGSQRHEFWLRQNKEGD